MGARHIKLGPKLLLARDGKVGGTTIHEKGREIEPAAGGGKTKWREREGTDRISTSFAVEKKKLQQFWGRSGPKKLVRLKGGRKGLNEKTRRKLKNGRAFRKTPAVGGGSQTRRRRKKERGCSRRKDLRSLS